MPNWLTPYVQTFNARLETDAESLKIKAAATRQTFICARHGIPGAVERWEDFEGDNYERFVNKLRKIKNESGVARGTKGNLR